MYGIVNKSIEELVLAHYGSDTWQEIKEKSGINIEYFISVEQYDDDITYKLAGTIAELQQISVDEVLKSFGSWWILHTGKLSYGYLLESGGDNFRSFLVNLPAFHNRVMMLYPKLTPPEFQVSDVHDHYLHLHYLSKRKGLTAFVIGLISGLGTFFNTEVQTEHIASVEGPHTHEIIKVSWSDRSI